MPHLRCSWLIPWGPSLVGGSPVGGLPRGSLPPSGGLLKMGPPRLFATLRGAPPVGQRQVKKLLRHGSRSRSPLLLLPTHVPIHELRVFLRLPYPSVLSLCQVRQCAQTKTLRWRDTANRAFELVNKRNVLVDFHRAAHAAKRFGLRAIMVDPEPDWQQQQQEEGAIPVAALLGHINHGKTTLLDRLAGTLVAPYEAGGITQQLLGVTVRYNNNANSSSSNSSSSNSSSSRLISFIDTPGHAAMETMRARAAAAADVAVVVIEAERGGQQQTAEVIKQADACGLPVLFVLNKIDRLLPSGSSNSGSDSSSNSCSEAVLRRLQQMEALRDGEEAEALALQAAAARASAAAATAAAKGTAEAEARQQLLLMRMQLRRDCQRLFEAGEVTRDLSREAMRALPVSALYGYGIDGLIRRLLELTDSLQLPLRMPASLSSTPGAAARYKHVARRSDCLVEAHLSPSAVAVILDIQQTRDRGLIYTVLLKAGALLPGSYFVAGSVYGRIATVSRYTCKFRGAPYTPDALSEDQGVPGSRFEAGSVLQVSTQRGKEGEAAIDDLFICLPQPRAFRLAQHRQRLEGLMLQQIDGPLLQLPWEVDHPKEAGSRWRLQQQQQQQIRRPVSEGRRAIEEFGFSDDEEAQLASSSSSNSSTSDSHSRSLFSEATRGEFARPLRSLPLSGRGVSAPLDELELLSKSRGRAADGELQQLSSQVELEPIVVMPAEDQEEQALDRVTLQQTAETERGPPAATADKASNRGAPSLGRRRRSQGLARGGPTLPAGQQEEGEEEEAEGDACMHNNPWGLVESREEWAERVVRENEELMSRWRTRSKQRKEAYEVQQRLERVAAVEAEQQRRAALQEPLMTEEEIRQFVAGTEAEESDRGRTARQDKTIPAPPKNAPVVPVILRTRYVGNFDMMLDEFEKLEAEMHMRIPVVHGGIGPVIPRDVVHAEVERTYGYCPIYAFQVPVLPDAVKQAVVSKVIIKKFDVFTDLLQDVRGRCENIRRLQDHNLYVRSLKKQPTRSGL
ncbi:hypothetical protein Efla_001479 [Eimeria flavescens]